MARRRISTVTAFSVGFCLAITACGARTNGENGTRPNVENGTRPPSATPVTVPPKARPVAYELYVSPPTSVSSRRPSLRNAEVFLRHFPGK